VIKAAGPRFSAFGQAGDETRFVMLTSQAEVERVAAGGEGVVATPSTYRKCERCWHYRPDVGASPDHPEICGRCVSNLSLPGETRRFA
jgi:isoleucyl-tRNA synthetase